MDFDDMIATVRSWQSATDDIEILDSRGVADHRLRLAYIEKCNSFIRSLEHVRDNSRPTPPKNYKPREH